MGLYFIVGSELLLLGVTINWESVSSFIDFSASIDKVELDLKDESQEVSGDMMLLTCDLSSLNRDRSPTLGELKQIVKAIHKAIKIS
tara:strand:- start:977 stop:1237 length:261 start_codon:yes stop_codon:yes gene_type:complete